MTEMTKVKFNTAISSRLWSFGGGEVGEIPADEAKRYAASGAVSILDVDIADSDDAKTADDKGGDVETATEKDAVTETADEPKSKRGRGRPKADK